MTHQELEHCFNEEHEEVNSGWAGLAESGSEVSDGATLQRLIVQYLEWLSPDHWTISESSLGYRIRHIKNQINHPDSTVVKLHWRVPQQEMWIDHLQLPARDRGQGIGTSIVQAIFLFASVVGATSVVVMPLQSAMGFWLKNGFQVHLRKSKILQRVLPQTNPTYHTAGNG